VTLERVLGEWRARANALRATGHAHDGELIDQVCDDLAKADPMPELLAWLSEPDAMLYEGRTTPDGLRARFTELEARGLAKWDERQRVRWYRRLALRHRGCPEAARAAGRRAGAA
jgi:hypothetical protein